VPPRRRPARRPIDPAGKPATNLVTPMTKPSDKRAQGEPALSRRSFLKGSIAMAGATSLPDAGVAAARGAADSPPPATAVTEAPIALKHGGLSCFR